MGDYTRKNGVRKGAYRPGWELLAVKQAAVIASWDGFEQADDGDSFEERLGNGEDIAGRVALQAYIEGLLKRLSEVQRCVIWERACGASTRELALRLGVSRQRVSQIEQEGYRRLRGLAMSA